MLRATFLLATLLSGCVADRPDSSTSGGGGKGDGQEPTLTFAADFTQMLDTQLVAGSPVRVRYALERLTSCRTESSGSAQWSVSGYAQFDTGDTVTFAVSRLDNGMVVPVDAELAIPASASTVALWFTISDGSGCIAYDSNDNANYQYNVDRHGLGAVLTFTPDGNVFQTGPIHAGDQIVVDYAPFRVGTCNASSGGSPQWGITGHWMIDGGPAHDFNPARADGDQLVAADPIIVVPIGSDLAMWFESTNIYGCHAYDSAYGQNFHFGVN
jgi:hypothetical protein